MRYALTDRQWLASTAVGTHTNGWYQIAVRAEWAMIIMPQ